MSGFANTLKASSEVDEKSRQLAVNQGVTLISTAAFLSLIASVSLFLGGATEQGIFVGIWVPSILSFGNLIINRRNHV